MTAPDWSLQNSEVLDPLSLRRLEESNQESRASVNCPNFAESANYFGDSATFCFRAGVNFAEKKFADSAKLARYGSQFI